MSEIDEVEIDKQSIVLDDRLSNELYLKKTDEELKSGDFAALLGAGFLPDMEKPINEGYPILSWQDTICFQSSYQVSPNALYKLALKKENMRGFRCTALRCPGS